MQRGNQLNVHRDDEVKRELQGRIRSGHPTRAEEWDDTEPGADDDPAVTERMLPAPVPGGMGREEAEAEALRSDLARHLGRHSFPTDRQGLERALQEQHAPDALLEVVEELPEHGGPYRNVQAVMAALGRKPRV
jgi:hypothetical protein